MANSVIFKSSVGKKMVMGLTGLFLVSFLLVHCFINQMIFWDSSGQLFNEYAHFMGTNIIIRITEVGLFAGLLVHIIDGLLLYFQNKAARKTPYVMTNASANSSWYSRSMAILGILLLMFMIIHLYHFWVPSRITHTLQPVIYENGVPQHNLYQEMLFVFSNPYMTILYVLLQIPLGYHLLHGFKSGFQSLGINHTKYNDLIDRTGMVIAVVIPILFAAMPVMMYFRANP